MAISRKDRLLLESVPWRVWTPFFPIRPSSHMSGPGVYVIFSMDGDLLYIGSSKDMRKRIVKHRCENPEWMRLPHLMGKYALCFKVGEWLYLEARLIHKLNPPFNRQKYSIEVGR